MTDPVLHDSIQRVLVTGGAGFIGSNVVDALIAAGRDVVIYDNFRTGKRELIAAAIERGATLVEGDLRDRESVQRLFAERRFDAVVHLAAMAGVRASVADPATYYDVNLGGTLALL